MQEPQGVTVVQLCTLAEISVLYLFFGQSDTMGKTKSCGLQNTLVQ